jgi:hypothetical protein
MAGYLVAAVGTTLQYFTDQGVVLAGGTVSTFVAGTSTPVATFTDSTLGVSNGTVITLTSAGRLPASCWVGTGTKIKMVLKDSGGNPIANGTIDNLSGIGDPFGQTAFFAQTAAEISAGVTPVNYSMPSHIATNGIFYPERYGTNTTPGTTPMSAIIQTAITVATTAGGGEIVLSDTQYQLGTIAVTVPASVKIRGVKGNKIVVDSSAPANMPQAYFSITGGNVEIDGVLGSIAANPFTVYAAKGSFIGLGASNLSNIRVHDCDSTWFMHFFFASNIAATVANTATNVVIERNRSTSFATDIFNIGLSPTNWTIRDNTSETISHTLSNNGGAIQIMPGVNLANVDAFTQSFYDTGYGSKIVITGNSLLNSLDRPIRIMNCQQVEVSDNNLSLRIGSFFNDSTLYSADALTFDFCRKVSCHNNTILGSGENAVDWLSCQDFECHDNVLKQCNTAGVIVFLSDLWNSSVTSPKLSSITTRTAIQSQNGEIHDNYIEAFDCANVSAGQNIKVHDNLLKVFRASTNWISGNTPLLVALDNSSGAAYFTESTANWEHDIEFKGNKPVLVGSVSVTASSATNIFTTVGAVPHGFVTGDRVESVASGTSTTVDYPGGVDYKLDYFVILVTSTTFKLATTLVNAFAGTAITISSNGLTVAGSALLFREQVWPPSVNISSSYYSPDRNIVLDENIGIVSVNTFSTLTTINPSTAFLFKNMKNQFTYDPAVNYTLARNTIDKFYPMQNIRASDGVVVYGLAPSTWASGGYGFAVGARPANIIGSPADGSIKTTLW